MRAVPKTMSYQWYFTPVVANAPLLAQGLVNTLKSRQVGRFRPGDKVRHPIFGDGIVVKSTGAGDQEQVNVLFGGHGEKKLAVSIARLDKLP